MTTMTDCSFDSGLKEWAAVVGPGHVVTAPAALHETETGTFRMNSQVSAIVRPANTPEVQQCLRVANRFGIPVYPISTGKIGDTVHVSRSPTARLCSTWGA